MSKMEDLEAVKLEIGQRYRKYTAVLNGERTQNPYITIYFNTNPDDLDNMPVPVANIHLNLNVDATKPMDAPRDVLSIIRKMLFDNIRNNRNNPIEARYVGRDVPTTQKTEATTRFFLQAPSHYVAKQKDGSQVERRYYAVADVFNGSIPGYDTRTLAALINPIQHDTTDAMHTIDTHHFTTFLGFSGKLCWIARREPQMLSTREELLAARNSYAPKLGGSYSNEGPTGTVAELHKKTKPPEHKA